ncbi:MAG: hypothetical protein JWN52_3150 [Actinomycetia bacterium]|nr:hypothetical protein [Actinomycetes bacterium]
MANHQVGARASGQLQRDRTAEVISKTIDEVVEPNVLIRTPLPVDATGAQALKQVWAVLLRAFPDLGSEEHRNRIVR